jgi:hypothetical protein
MRANRQTLINDLVGDLRPVKRPGQVGFPVAAWLGIAILYSIVMVFMTGPMRPGALHDLIEYPAFAAETSLAMLAIVAIAFAAAQSAIPGEPRPVRRLWRTLVPLAAWIAFYVVGLWYPAHPVSTLGSREHCIWEIVLFSLPTLALMLWIARRQFPLWPRSTGLLAGTAAAAIPGALMQFGCMYVPEHILMYHVGPIALTAALGAAIGPFVLKVSSAAPRRREVSMH